MAWDKNKPAGTDSMKISDNKIRENWTSIEDEFGAPGDTANGLSKYMESNGEFNSLTLKGAPTVKERIFPNPFTNDVYVRTINCSYTDGLMVADDITKPAIAETYFVDASSGYIRISWRTDTSVPWAWDSWDFAIDIIDKDGNTKISAGKKFFLNATTAISATVDGAFVLDNGAGAQITSAYLNVLLATVTGALTVDGLGTFVTIGVSGVATIGTLTAGTTTLNSLGVTTSALFSGTVSMINTPDNFSHATTEKTIVLSAASIVNTTVLPVTQFGHYTTPLAADSNFYNGTQSLNLPEGATVTKVELIGYTGASIGDIVICDLERFEFDGSMYVRMSRTSITNGGVTDSDTSINNPTISNSYYYLIRLYQRADGSILDSKFYGAKITYTVVNLAQTI